MLVFDWGIVAQFEFLALTIDLCVSRALFFVSSQCINLVRLFSVMMYCTSYEASLPAEQCLCFNKTETRGEDLAPVICI